MDVEVNATDAETDATNASRDDDAARFPELIPSVPDSSQREVGGSVANPFMRDGIAHHPKHGHWRETAKLRNVKEVNGLLKFSRNTTGNTAYSSLGRRPFNWNSPKASVDGRIAKIIGQLPWLPRDFGRGFAMTVNEAALLAFCKWNNVK